MTVITLDRRAFDGSSGERREIFRRWSPASSSTSVIRSPKVQASASPSRKCPSAPGRWAGRPTWPPGARRTTRTRCAAWRLAAGSSGRPSGSAPNMSSGWGGPTCPPFPIPTPRSRAPPGDRRPAVLVRRGGFANPTALDRRLAVTAEDGDLPSWARSAASLQVDRGSGRRVPRRWSPPATGAPVCLRAEAWDVFAGRRAAFRIKYRTESARYLMNNRGHDPTDLSGARPPGDSSGRRYSHRRRPGGPAQRG